MNPHNLAKMYDIIIVGAGPSGCSAALYANKLGLKSLLVDKAVFPRDKVCGDALSGKTVRILRDLKLLNELESLDGAGIKRITFGGPNHNQFDVFLNGSEHNDYVTKGYVIPRIIFDHFLFQKASEVSKTIEGFTVKDILKDDGKISGITGDTVKNKNLKFKAPLILGADGPNSIIARKVGYYGMDMKNTAVAIRCYYEGVEGLSDQIELHYLKEINPGYLWVFPAGGDKANVGLGLSKDAAKKESKNLRQVMNDILLSKKFKRRFKNAKPLEKPIGWNLPLGRIQRKNYGDGFLLLGDAAGLVDPFTGEGIGNGMLSGKYAVQVAQKAHKSNDFSESILSEYDKLIWGDIGGELRTSTKLADLAKSEFMLNFVISRASRNKTVRDIISGMLSQEISKDELSRPSFYFKILFS
mgnify:CR=1 FL=1|tara:strand:- start:22539 stop:23777 length:1239 start_codon:yes stop_codon:yes gene_type:complete